MRHSLIVKRTDTFTLQVVESDIQYKKMERIKYDKKFVVQPRFPRNIKFHNLMFATFERIAEKTTLGTIDNVRHWLLLKLGYCDVVSTPDGKMAIPHSMSFESMSEQTAHEFYEKVLDVCAPILGEDFKELV